MIRGIEGVIKPAEMTVGGVYLDPGYGRGTTLFQWVRTGETREGSTVESALILASDVGQPLEIQNIVSDGGLVKMPPISIRVDPPSASGTALRRSLGAGLFLVDDNRPVVVAKVGYSGYISIDLSTGRPIRPSHHWISFSRWSVVVDEAGEEISIASFGDEGTS